MNLIRTIGAAVAAITLLATPALAIPTRERVPPAPPQPWADLPKVLELAKLPNAVIKVSGACTLSREPYPFPDIWDPLARVLDAWGFMEHLVLLVGPLGSHQ
jgi:hypothetical protein